MSEPIVSFGRSAEEWPDLGVGCIEFKTQEDAQKMAKLLNEMTEAIKRIEERVAYIEGFLVI
jgi:hypothetical protein